MRIMIFCDLENFRYSIRERYPNNVYVDVNFEKFHEQLLTLVGQKLGCDGYTPRLLRAYVYTGEYTDGQINRSKKFHEHLPEKQERLKTDLGRNEERLSGLTGKDKERCEKSIRKLKSMILSDDRIENLGTDITKARERQKKQSELFRKIEPINFIELRAKPLKFSPKDLRFVQKGTDVQLGVDLVHFAHLDNYDVAVVCSGDLDLLESCRIVKELGKTLVLISHNNQVSPQMITMADYYLNIAEMQRGEIDNMSIRKTFEENYC